MKFEYKIQRFTANEMTEDIAIDTLNLLGDEGWEAVGMDSHPAYHFGKLEGTAILLKRPKP